jgi:hypothetical protein
MIAARGRAHEAWDRLRALSAAAALAAVPLACDDEPVYVAEISVERLEAQALASCETRPGTAQAVSGACPKLGAFTEEISCREAVGNCFTNFRSNRPRSYACFWLSARIFVFEERAGDCPTSPPAPLRR